MNNFKSFQLVPKEQELPYAVQQEDDVEPNIREEENTADPPEQGDNKLKSVICNFVYVHCDWGNHSCTDFPE